VATSYDGPVEVAFAHGVRAAAVAHFASRMVGIHSIWSGTLRFADTGPAVRPPKLGQSLMVCLPSGRTGAVLLQHIASPHLRLINVQGTGRAPF
jgi:hypothetical protein